MDSKNQLTSAAGFGCAYDANGNLTNYASYHRYDYDDENRLVSVYDGTYKSYRTDFVYDGLGRMRVKQDYTWSGGTWVAGSAERYMYDGNRVIQERDGSNVPTVSYTRGNDLSGTMEGAGGIGGLLGRSAGYSSGSWTNHAFYHSDGNGNVTCMTDAGQHVVASYKYDPYGNLMSSSGTLASANVYRFSSKEYINNAGYYYLYRFYDPYLQRWLNRDPIAEWGHRDLRGACMTCYSALRNDVNWYAVLRQFTDSGT